MLPSEPVGGRSRETELPCYIYGNNAAFIASGKYGVSHFQVPSFPVHKWSVFMRIFPPNSATKWRPELLCLFWPYFRHKLIKIANGGITWADLPACMTDNCDKPREALSALSDNTGFC